MVMAGDVVIKWRNMAPLADYNSAKLALFCKLSPRQLQRQFRRYLGCSPQRWLDSERLEVAQKRLLRGDRIKEIALELGFSDSSHFCHHFKAALRLTPSEFVESRASLIAPFNMTKRFSTVDIQR